MKIIRKIQSQINNIFSSIKFSGLAGIIGLLGCYGGSQNTSLLWRRAGIPLIFTICALIETRSLWSILLMSMWGFFSLGYGIPDHFEGGDSGSTLGRFWTQLIDVWYHPSRRILADIFTRGTVGLGICFSFLIIPILKRNWLYYILGSLGIIFIYMFNSWRGYGTFEFKLKGKNYTLAKVDMITYGILGMCGLLIILKG